jgi:hypothetical protein
MEADVFPPEVVREDEYNIGSRSALLRGSKLRKPYTREDPKR